MKTPKGYEEISTGGGCTAWYKRLTNHDGHALITADAVVPTDPREPVLLGIYGAHGGQQLICFDCRSTREATKIVERILLINDETVFGKD